MSDTGTGVAEVASATSRSKKDSSTDPLSSSTPFSGQSEPLLYVGGSKECSEKGCTSLIPVGSRSGMCPSCFGAHMDEPVGRILF
ncbi:hypothetical protein ACFL24_00790 [Patescibacteria group bacterium]